MKHGDTIEKTLQNNPYPHVFTAGEVLDCVEEWASERCLFMVRELSLSRTLGRYDAVLVPTGQGAHMMGQTRTRYWDRPGIIIVEAKVTRSDFLNGLATGQYARYNRFSALYIATPYGICTRDEIPEGIGHLVVTVRRSMRVCICRRAPTWNTKYEFNREMFWRILFRAIQHLERQVGEVSNRYARRAHKLGRMIGDRFGDLFDGNAQKRNIP